MFGTYLFDKTPYTSPDSFGNVQLQSLSSRQIVAVEETHSFTPSFVNAVRFGYNHENVNNNSSLNALVHGGRECHSGRIYWTERGLRARRRDFPTCREE